jgi:hypothetical protein
LTEREADLLCRLAGEKGALAEAIRWAINRAISTLGGAAAIRDTHRALTSRELRKAKRVASPEADALEKLFDLNEAPESAAPPTETRGQELDLAKMQVERVPDPNAGKVLNINVRRVGR